MTYLQFQNSGNPPRNFTCDALQGNWYEDRCISDFDKRKKKNYLLPNANQWQYQTTYNQLNKGNSTKSQERFSVSNDNCINFQEKDNKMYITTYKHSMDPKYKSTFKPTPLSTDYFKGRPEELQELRSTWTKRPQLMETSYKMDVLSKTANNIIFKK